MDDDIRLLNAIIKNTEMGTSSLEQILDATENEAFKSSLQIQQKGFSQLKQEAAQALAMRGVEPEGTGVLAKLGSTMSIAGKTMMDNSTRHLADMLIQGSSMGTIDCVKAVRDNPKASAEVQNLAKRLEEFEQRNVEELKNFL